MGSLKRVVALTLAGMTSLFVLAFTPATSLTAHQTSSSGFTQEQTGRILFLIHRGEIEPAVKSYQDIVSLSGIHDFELLHAIGLGILNEGFHTKDPECQLLSLFGASVAAHEDVYAILEKSLRHPRPEIQMIALSALAQFQNDQADQLLISALGSPSLLIRYEAARFLCRKKHPQAVNHAESLMYKTPAAFHSLFPPLFASVESPGSTVILRRLLNNRSKSVRLATLISIGKSDRDDLLPQIKMHLSQNHFSEQEASAYIIGKLKDEQSIKVLQDLCRSSCPPVALSAHRALYTLGFNESAAAIEERAQKNDLFAISLLGQINERPEVLLKLIESPDLQVRCNSVLALLEQHHPKGLELIDEILIRDYRDLGFIRKKTPGKSMNCRKVVSSMSQLYKDDRTTYIKHLEFKELCLKKVRELSESKLISLAHIIFNKQQNELVPFVVQQLEEIGSSGAIECLKTHHQQLGAPLVRIYCKLALYRMHEPGPFAENIQEWVRNQSKTEFIRFKPSNPWKPGENPYLLTPEETSRALIDACQTLAANQEQKGIETLLEAIGTGHVKNRYALAGLLIRASQ